MLHVSVSSVLLSQVSTTMERYFEGHRDSVTCSAFNPDTKQLGKGNAETGQIVVFL